MKFVIVGKNIDLTEGLKSAVEDKIGKLDTGNRGACYSERGKGPSENRGNYSGQGQHNQIRTGQQ